MWQPTYSGENYNTNYLLSNVKFCKTNYRAITLFLVVSVQQINMQGRSSYVGFYRMERARVQYAKSSKRLQVSQW